MRLPLQVRRILIINQVSLNLGDAAILWGNIEILRRKYGPDTQILVFDNAADAAQKYRPWANFYQALFYRPARGWLGEALQRRGYGHWYLRLRFFKFLFAVLLLKHRFPVLAGFIVSDSELADLRKYANADLIVSAGGTYLVENYDLAPKIMELRLAIATGKPLVLFTQSLGPFKHPRNRRYFKNIFSAAAVILLRDERSRGHILELNAEPKNIQLAADAAFVLARDTTNRHVFVAKPPRSVEPFRLAISVRSMKYFHDLNEVAYFESMALAVQVAVKEFGAKVTFLSTCQGIPEYWANDADTADKICAMLPEEIHRQHVEVDRQFRQPWEMVDVYESFDAVIATRMHAAILSLCSGTPTLGVAYEFKMVELFKNIGMPELVLSVCSLTANDMKTCVQRLLSQRDVYQPRVKAAAEKMYKDAWMVERALPEIRYQAKVSINGKLDSNS